METQLNPRSDPGASFELTSACHLSWLTGNKLLKKTYFDLRHTSDSGQTFGQGVLFLYITLHSPFHLLLIQMTNQRANSISFIGFYEKHNIFPLLCEEY